MNTLQKKEFNHVSAFSLFVVAILPFPISRSLILDVVFILVRTYSHILPMPLDMILDLGLGLHYIFLLLVSSGCLTGSWSVWSHAVTPHSTIYHLVFVI